MARRMRIGRAVLILTFMILLLSGVWMVEYGEYLADLLGNSGRASLPESAGNLSGGQEKESSIVEITDSGIDLHFCPRDDCEGALFELLDSANASIHCATYEMNLPRIISLLQNKSIAGLDVKLVVDNEYFDEVENFSFARKDGKQGLMHDKFCIVDGRLVYTGSMNPTNNCAYKNNNNLLIIESNHLAKNYEEEFSELWAGVFGKGEEVPYPEIIWNNISIKNYFCPEDDCQGMVRAELEKAESCVYFMAFSFTDDFIGRDLAMMAAEGIDVRGVFEKTKLSNYSEYNLLKYQGIDVRTDTNKYNLHHKVFIIDNRSVILGSYNPTANANTDNDENILVLYDEEIAGRFAGEFWGLYLGEDSLGSS